MTSNPTTKYSGWHEPQCSYWESKFILFVHGHKRLSMIDVLKTKSLYLILLGSETFGKSIHQSHWCPIRSKHEMVLCIRCIFQILLPSWRQGILDHCVQHWLICTEFLILFPCHLQFFGTLSQYNAQTCEQDCMSFSLIHGPHGQCSSPHIP